jgi:hypothetical protein
MAIGWFIVPYKRDLIRPRPTRYCAMDDFTAAIRADGGDWAETEVLGDRAIVKARAKEATLDKIASVYKRLPVDRLGDSLTSQPAEVKTALIDELENMGYSQAELQRQFARDLGNYTLGDVLRFAAGRRLKPRYDAATDAIVCDGIEQACRSVESVDEEVKEK